MEEKLGTGSRNTATLIAAEHREGAGNGGSSALLPTPLSFPTGWPRLDRHETNLCFLQLSFVNYLPSCFLGPSI